MIPEGSGKSKQHYFLIRGLDLDWNDQHPKMLAMSEIGDSCHCHHYIPSGFTRR